MVPATQLLAKSVISKFELINMLIVFYYVKTFTANLAQTTIINFSMFKT